MSRDSGPSGTSGAAALTNAERPFAVIDIGSNTVRLVVYHGAGRHPDILFNEKVQCGLGKGVGESGLLDREAMFLALKTLRRFRILCDSMDVCEIAAVATAAVRDARNGPDLIARAAHEAGIDIRLLSGEEEARYSVYGVLSGIPEAEGLVGDLGGGSLELCFVRDGKIRRAESYPLGPVRFTGQKLSDADQRRQRIEAVLGTEGWIAETGAKKLYIVGGSWRALMRVHMNWVRAPLPIIHEYTVSASALIEFCRIVSLPDGVALGTALDSAENRRGHMPAAAEILETVVNLGRIEEVVTSSFGLREGLVFERLPGHLRAEHPLIGACRALARKINRFGSDGDAFFDWLSPLFDARESKEDKLLRLCICLLSDIAWQGHPDFRAERALVEVLYGRFVGIGHRGRAFVAFALYVDYGGPSGAAFAQTARALLNREEQMKAEEIGRALRLAKRFTGGASVLLKEGRLRLDDDALALEVTETGEKLVGESVTGRLERLAGMLKRTAAIRRLPG